MDLVATPEWRALLAHRDKGSPSLRELFANEPDRVSRLSLELGDLHIDLSKQHLDRHTLDLLLALARRAEVE